MGVSITEEMIDAALGRVQFHHFEGTQLVVCCITLKNGFSVCGTANAHNPSAFNMGQAREIAREQARDKIAPFLSYAIRERLQRAKMPELHFQYEPRAKEIYDGWRKEPGWVPWVDRGNSDMQEKARRLAEADQQASPFGEVVPIKGIEPDGDPPFD